MRRVLIALTGIEYMMFLQRLARETWGGDVDVYGFAHSRRWVGEAMDLGLPRDHILYISERRRALLNAPVDYGYLRRMETEFGLPTLWPFVVAEKLLWGKPYEYVLKTLEVEFRLITAFLDEIQPDALLLEAVAGISSYIMWSWARRHGRRMILPFQARLPGRFVVLDNPYDQWTTVERRFAEIHRRGLSPADRERADALRRDVIDRQVQPSYVTTTLAQFNPPRLAADAAHGARYVRNYIRYRGWEDYTTRSPWYYAGAQLMKQMRVLGHRMTRFYEQPRPGERYVLYPLQISPEAGVMVLAPFLTDQIALIESVARSLPIDHRLYVKEHIIDWFSRPFSFYRELRRIPNVRLISPFVSAHSLIRHASAVTSTTSTMGLEALFFGKPVVMFGRVFHNAYPQVRRVRAVEDLPGILHELLTAYEPDHDLFLEFLAAILAGSYPGQLDPYAPEFLAPENVSAVAAGIRQELNSTGEPVERAET